MSSNVHSSIITKYHQDKGNLYSGILCSKKMGIIDTCHSTDEYQKLMKEAQHRILYALFHLCEGQEQAKLVNIIEAKLMFTRRCGGGVGLTRDLVELSSDRNLLHADLGSG